MKRTCIQYFKNDILISTSTVCDSLIQGYHADMGAFTVQNGTITLRNNACAKFGIGKELLPEKEIGHVFLKKESVIKLRNNGFVHLVFHGYGTSAMIFHEDDKMP